MGADPANGGRLSYVSFGANGQPQYHFIGTPNSQQPYQQAMLNNSGKCLFKYLFNQFRWSSCYSHWSITTWIEFG